MNEKGKGSVKKSLVAVIAVCAAMSLQAGATECLAIKQDKARLKCYDDREKATAQQAQESQAVAQQEKNRQEAEFKKRAAIFVRDAEANLTLAALQWQNFIDAPSAKPVQEVLANNKKIQLDVENSFTTLMLSSNRVESIAEKLKDYYAAWGLAFNSVRPTQADSGRAFSARIHAELNKSSALAERLKIEFL
ncbi:MAG: hypothetical protein K2X55_26965 [Burkholderiaceae bacterium]|nr:hypothetical protein [Burkholderiaceae bacterium]